MMLDVMRVAGFWGVPLDVRRSVSREQVAVEGELVREKQVEKPLVSGVVRVERAQVLWHQFEEEVLRENRVLQAEMWRVRGMEVYGKGRKK